MRNPARKALYCLVALAAGIALIRFGALRLERIEEDELAAAAIALGFALAPFGFVFLIQSLLAARGRALLLAGRGVIARWHVPPAEWDRFRGLDDRRAGEDLDLGNDLWVRRETPREGVEVIVGEKSLLVDGSYHALRPGGLPELRSIRWLEGPPRCLEFGLLYPRGRYGGKVPTTVRVPVPAAALGTAQKVIAHYEPLCRPRPGLAVRQPRHRLEVCAVLAVLALPLGAAGYTAASEGAIAPALIIAAVILAIFATLAALAALLFTRPGSR